MIPASPRNFSLRNAARAPLVINALSNAHLPQGSQPLRNQAFLSS
jgi:hypothetical protein